MRVSEQGGAIGQAKFAGTAEVAIENQGEMGGLQDVPRAVRPHFATIADVQSWRRLRRVG